MASSSWIPPIPGGKLISKPVRDLGSAVTFLHWCYEAVRRDGTIEFQIHDVAGYLGESYYTVRKWWSLVKDGPWFEDVADRGKRGFAVKMSSDWLEWRAYDKSTNYGQVPDRAFEDSKPATPVSNTDKAPDPVLDDVQVAVKLPSSGGEVHDQVLETTAYKVLNIARDHDSSPASDDAVTPPTDEGETIVANTPNRNPTGRKMPPAAPLSIRQAMADVCQIDLDGGTASKGQVIDLNKQAGRAWKAAQAQGKTEAECAEAVRYVAGWIKKTVYPYTNGQPLKPAAILDRWRAAMDARPKPTVYANGAYANGTHPPDDPSQYLTREQLRALRRGGS